MPHDEMTVAEARQLTEQLEAEIFGLVAKYAQQTGLTPRSIQLDLIDNSVMGSPRRLAIAGVKVEVDL